MSYLLRFFHFILESWQILNIDYWVTLCWMNQILRSTELSSITWAVPDCLVWWPYWMYSPMQSMVTVYLGYWTFCFSPFYGANRKLFNFITKNNDSQISLCFNCMILKKLHPKLIADISWEETELLRQMNSYPTIHFTPRFSEGV